MVVTVLCHTDLNKSISILNFFSFERSYFSRSNAPGLFAIWAEEELFAELLVRPDDVNGLTVGASR
jgi:hypothetical protein